VLDVRLLFGVLVSHGSRRQIAVHSATCERTVNRVKSGIFQPFQTHGLHGLWLCMIEDMALIIEEENGDKANPSDEVDGVVVR
ncbi:hypothetical protein Ancab_030852, partial [Ancistrocladus abbreviatus]